jgi:adenylate cyclase
MTLVLPWVVMMSLGGFKESSVVIIWAALCPIVSLLVGVLRQTVLWIVGFVLLLIVSAILQPSLTPAALPEAFVTWFFVLNLGSVIAIVFALLYYPILCMTGDFEAGSHGLSSWNRIGFGC